MIHFSLNISNYLTYDGVTYKQIRGLPQGACDSGLLATIYLDSLLQTYKKLLFDNNFVVFWYKYMDDFLLYMPKERISIFTNEFEKITNLELEVEREKSINNGCSKISFLNLEILRYRSRIETRYYRKECASLRTLNYLSNNLHSTKTNVVKVFTQYILNRTHSNWLKHDLDTIIQKLIANYYPFSTIRKYMLTKITSHIAQLKDKKSSHFFCTKKKTHRMNILLNYASTRFNKRVNPYTKTNKKTPNCTYTKRTVYDSYCIPFWQIIRNFHKHFNLPAPVMRTRRINYHNLGITTTHSTNIMTNDSNDHPQDKNMNNSTQKNLRLGLTKCNGCEEYFLIFGADVSYNGLQKIVTDEKSHIWKHVKEHNHTPPDKVYALEHITKENNLHAQIALYEALLSANGMAIHKTAEFETIPYYIRKTITTIVARQNQKCQKRAKGNKKIVGPGTRAPVARDMDENMENNFGTCAPSVYGGNAQVPDVVDDTKAPGTYSCRREQHRRESISEPEVNISACVQGQDEHGRNEEGMETPLEPVRGTNMNTQDVYHIVGGRIYRSRPTI